MRISVNFHHDGLFSSSPLMYKEGDVSTIRDIDFKGMTLIALQKKLKGTCQFPIKGIYFLIPGKELSNGLMEITNDSILAECIGLAFKNQKIIDMYLEHHGYDLTHWLQTEVVDDEGSDVGEMEDITGYGASDFVGEDDVVIPNRTLNDSFLNKLCNGSFISDHIDIGEPSEPTYKELDSDSDDEHVDKKYKVVEGVCYPEFDPGLPWNEMKPTLGLRFEHPEQLKECLTNYGVKNGYQLWYLRNDYRTVMVICGKDIAEGRSGGKKGVKGDWPSKKGKGVQSKSPGKKGKGVQSKSPGKKGKGVQSSADGNKGKGKGTKNKFTHTGCTFRLWASWVQNGSCFQIKTLIPDHSCSRNFDLGALVSYKWIAKKFAFKIIQDPTISYRKIQEQTKKKFLINVSVGQCKRAKQRALFDHEGGLIEHYSRLWDYRQQILNTNPGSSVHLHVEEKDNGKTYFKRFYVCFKAMKEGWSAGCRKVIGLDGCFLKGTVKGELLTAMGRDANNQMFPIAWAVVNIENSDNWQWFMACLCEDLFLCEGAYMTIISDGHKGLMEAVHTMLPYAEHRQCARHIYANFKKKWNGLHYKSLFWGAASTTIQHVFYSKMNLIGNIDPEAKQYLVDRNPNSWCRAFFKMDRGCGAYENGISESYHNAIRIARGKPIITMLEEIRVYLMQRLYSMNNLASNLPDTITPSIRKEIEHLKSIQIYWTVYPSGDNVYEVRKGDESYGVNLENRTCTCNWWTLTGVPCVHTVAAYGFIKTDPVLGVSPWYSKRMWQNAYSYFIKPVGGSAMWPNTKDEPPLPPVQRKMPGRPRKLRIKHVTERVNEVSRSGRMMTCQICWEKGHNKKTCKNGPRPKPTKEKRAPGRKKAGSSFVFPSGVAGSGEAAGGAGEETAGAGTGEAAGDAGVGSSGVAGSGEAAGGAGEETAGAGTGEAAGDAGCETVGSGGGQPSSYDEVQMDSAVTEDPIENEIPTQTSRSKIVEDIEASIKVGTFKTASLKRRCPSERIAKRAKPYKFGPDGEGSSADKAWDVDDVLAEP